MGKSSEIEHLPAFRDVRQQNIHEWVLAVKCGTAPIPGRDDSFDCRQVALAQRIVLCPKEALSYSIGLNGIDPIVHYTPADESLHLLRPVPATEH